MKMLAVPFLLHQLHLVIVLEVSSDSKDVNNN